MPGKGLGLHVGRGPESPSLSESLFLITWIYSRTSFPESIPRSITFNLTAISVPLTYAVI